MAMRSPRHFSQIKVEGKGRRIGRGSRKGRAEADLWGRHGGDRFPEKWEEILNDRFTFDVNLFLITKNNST